MASNFNEIEGGIRLLVAALNSMDGVWTVSSCEGHPEDAVRSDGTRRNCLAYVFYHVSKEHEKDHEKWLLRVVEDSFRRRGYKVFISKVFRPLRRADSGNIVTRPASERWVYELSVWVKAGQGAEKTRRLLDRGIKNLVGLAGK